MRSIAAPTLLLLALAGPAGADNPKATARFEKGLELYKAKEYEKAIVELKAAYDLEVTIEHAYAYAQAERLSGDCEAAIPLYDKVLELKPPQELADAARDLITKCREEVAAKSAPPPATPQPTPPPLGSLGEPDDGVEAPRPWWKDPIGGALVGTGVVAVGAFEQVPPGGLTQLSVVQMSSSSHCVSLAQQPGMPVDSQRLLVRLQTSRVQIDPSEQSSVSESQQPVMGSEPQVWRVGSQTSAVQTSPSLAHSPLLRQQPGIAVCVHERVSSPQSSVVQTSPSSQSKSIVQVQPGIGTN